MGAGISHRRVLLQEWLAEAVSTWALAALVIVVTAVAGGTAAAAWSDRIAAAAASRRTTSEINFTPQGLASAALLPC